MPKALVAVGNRPLASYAVEALGSHAGVDGLVVGVPPGRRDGFRNALLAYAGDKPVRFAEGGAERQDTVRRALASVPEDAELVLVHDAARPFLAADMVDRLLAAARESGAAAPALVLTDTLVEVDVDGRAAPGPARDRLAAVQTPQAFCAGLLRSAHRWAASAGRGFTDDLTLTMDYLAGAAGQADDASRDARPVLVPGDPDLRKVTTPADLDWAEARSGVPAMRVGLGVDYHRFAAGRRLVLGGVEIEHPRGLLGHSDADVIAHAVADALLGAAALGDVGLHFPDSDPAFKDADSLELLKRVAGLLASHGWRPGNVDISVTAEEPRLAPHAARMRARLAGAIGVEAERVSVKATTAEGLGEVGRGAGIRAEAIATIHRERADGRARPEPRRPSRGTVRP